MRRYRVTATPGRESLFFDGIDDVVDVGWSALGRVAHAVLRVPDLLLADRQPGRTVLPDDEEYSVFNEADDT